VCGRDAGLIAITLFMRGCGGRGTLRCRNAGEVTWENHTLHAVLFVCVVEKIALH
jgi:hypothetical protein